MDHQSWATNRPLVKQQSICLLINHTTFPPLTSLCLCLTCSLLLIHRTTSYIPHYTIPSKTRETEEERKADMCYYEAQTYPCRRHMISYTFYYECPWLTTRRIWDSFNDQFFHSPSSKNHNGHRYDLPRDTTKPMQKPIPETKLFHKGQEPCNIHHARSHCTNVVVVEKTCPTCGAQGSQSPVRGCRWRFVRGDRTGVLMVQAGRAVGVGVSVDSARMTEGGGAGGGNGEQGEFAGFSSGSREGTERVAGKEE